MALRWVMVFALAVAGATVGGCRSETAATAAASARLTPVTITTAKGRHVFRVEIAGTPEEQQRGLMFRTDIPADGGMLFPFAVPRIASFWMKNTPSPLDIIFIRSDGTISSIAENTIPYSLDQVVSSEPVTAVLELAGGRTAALGIAAGDRVVWPQ